MTKAAQHLGLSDDVREKLRRLVERRENEAINLALSIKDLPPDIRAERLAPFVAESERQGMELLTQEQRSKLNQLRLQRTGMASLAEAETAQLLELTAGAARRGDAAHGRPGHRDDARRRHGATSCPEHLRTAIAVGVDQRPEGDVGSDGRPRTGPDRTGSADAPQRTAETTAAAATGRGTPTADERHRSLSR